MLFRVHSWIVSSLFFDCHSVYLQTPQPISPTLNAQMYQNRLASESINEQIIPGRLRHIESSSLNLPSNQLLLPPAFGVNLLSVSTGIQRIYDFFLREEWRKQRS